MDLKHVQNVSLGSKSVVNFCCEILARTGMILLLKELTYTSQNPFFDSMCFCSKVNIATQGQRTRYAMYRLIRNKCSYFCYMMKLSDVQTPNILFILEFTEICHDKRNTLYNTFISNNVVIF